MKASEFINEKLLDSDDVAEGSYTYINFLSLEHVRELLQKIGSGDIVDDIGGCEQSWESDHTKKGKSFL